MDATATTGWRWNQLAKRLEVGIDLAQRLNALGPSSSGLPGINVTELGALQDIANARRSRRGLVRRTA